jgi:hypothetical protein
MGSSYGLVHELGRARGIANALKTACDFDGTLALLGE